MLNILIQKYIELCNNRYIKSYVIEDDEDCLSMFFRKNKTVVKNQETEINVTKNLAKDENNKSECPHFYGYLAIRPKDSSIPQECLCCLKVIDCLSKTKK